MITPKWTQGAVADGAQNRRLEFMAYDVGWLVSIDVPGQRIAEVMLPREQLELFAKMVLEPADE